jgi:hypothetical protein
LSAVAHDRSSAAPVVSNSLDRQDAQEVPAKQVLLSLIEEDQDQAEESEVEWAYFLEDIPPSVEITVHEGGGLRRFLRMTGRVVKWSLLVLAAFVVLSMFSAPNADIH